MAAATLTLIQWIGHACFLIATVSGVHILIDPVGPKVGYPVTAHSIPADIIFVSHDHYDHNYIDLAMDTEPKPQVVGPRTKPGYSDGIFHFTVADGKDCSFKFRRIFAYHDNVEGKQRGIDTITTFDVDGLRICHLGDIGQNELTPKQIELIGKIDILMIPVGGYYTIDGKAAAHVVGQLHPKVIVPMHFRTQYVNEDLQEKLHPLDEFVAAMGPKVGILKGSTNVLALTPQTLPKQPTIVEFEL